MVGATVEFKLGLNVIFILRITFFGFSHPSYLLCENGKGYTIADCSLGSLPIFSLVLIYTISSITEDLINLDNYNVRNVMKIFVEGDRMVYFGIFIVLISILLFLIEMSS